MDFKEFVNKLEQDLKEALSDISPGAQVRQTPVEKLQAGSYTGISITPADTNIGMNLNANLLFAQMQEGRSYEGVLAVAVSQAERGLHDMPSVDVQAITNYETAKNLLCFEVVGTEQNADILANIPHTDVENMSMVYRLQLDACHKYGAYGNVLLSDDDYGKLMAEFPADYLQRIERLSEYMASSGKSYKNHLAAIRSWARKEKPAVKSGYSHDICRYEEGESL